VARLVQQHLDAAGQDDPSSVPHAPAAIPACDDEPTDRESGRAHDDHGREQTAASVSTDTDTPA
jgi:hypothetical protein